MITPQVFDSAEKYLLSCSDLKARIERLGQIISALEIMSVSAATTGNFEEYSLDDGQTKIRTRYRNMTDVAAAIAHYDGLQQRLIARYNNNNLGRMIRLTDHKNFN